MAYDESLADEIRARIGARPDLVEKQMFGGIDKFSLMSMPFFVLAANVMTAGGLSRRIVDWTLSIVGSFRGGLGLATQVSTMFVCMI